MKGSSKVNVTCWFLVFSMSLFLLVTFTNGTEWHADEMNENKTPIIESNNDSDENRAMSILQEALKDQQNNFNDDHEIDSDEGENDDIYNESENIISLDEDAIDDNNDDDDDDDDDNDEDDNEEDDDVTLKIEKRNLGALARKGDMAARRIYGLKSLQPRNYDRDDDGKSWSKRHIGAFERGGGLRVRPQTRSLNDETDDQDDIVKRNIAALARQGSLTNLRFQRRPMPWISDEDYGYDGRYHESQGSGAHNDGYKRNLHAFSRVSTPGSGFRSWLRGRLSVTAPMKLDTKRKNNYRHHQRFRLAGRGLSPDIEDDLNEGPFGGVQASSKGRGRGRRLDRFRGVRSTRHRYLNAGVGPANSRGRLDETSSSFRAPMAFVSRHHLWKRDVDLKNDFLRGLRAAITD